VLLGTYVGAETGIGAWLTHYVVSTHHVSLDYAGTCLAFYWSGLAAGRLLLGGLAHRVRQERLILALAVLATAGLAVALRAPSAPGAFLGFTVTGLGFSGIFPATIALGGQYRPQAATQVTRLLIIGAGVGGVAVPWTMSAIVAHAGVGAGMGFYTAVAAMMIALALALPRSAHSA
jgi:fucose permease